jgi:hypothetical protein
MFFYDWIDPYDHGCVERSTMDTRIGMANMPYPVFLHHHTQQHCYLEIISV